MAPGEAFLDWNRDCPPNQDIRVYVVLHIRGNRRFSGLHAGYHPDPWRGIFALAGRTTGGSYWRRAYSLSEALCLYYALCDSRPDLCDSRPDWPHLPAHWWW